MRGGRGEKMGEEEEEKMRRGKMRAGRMYGRKARKDGGMRGRYMTREGGGGGGGGAGGGVCESKGYREGRDGEGGYKE